MKEFSLSDEGGYWETDDETVLSDQFSAYDSALKIVSETLQNMFASPDETIESLAERIERLLSDKFKDEAEE